MSDVRWLAGLYRGRPVAIAQGWSLNGRYAYLIGVESSGQMIALSPDSVTLFRSESRTEWSMALADAEQNAAELAKQPPSPSYDTELPSFGQQLNRRA